MFGYAVPLFYQEKNKKKTSGCGAVMTIFMIMLIFVYTTIQLLNSKDTANQTVTVTQFDLDLANEEPIYLDKSDTKLFATLWQPSGALTQDQRDNLDQYIKITYRQKSEDWNKPVGEIYSEDLISMTPCTKYEFGDDEYAQAFLDSWQNENYYYDLFCPDLKKEKDLKLYNQKGAMVSNSVIFRIELCDKTERYDCKSDDEIKEFVKLLTVQFWIIDSSLDLQYFEGQSLKKNMKLVSQHNLKYKDEIKNDLVQLNSIEYISIESVLRNPDHHHEYVFLKVQQIYPSDIIRTESNEQLLFQTQFFLSPSRQVQKRVIGSVLDVLSQIGGLMKIVQSAFLNLTLPISQFLFTFVMIKRMYFAKTKDEDLFTKDNHNHGSGRSGGHDCSSKYLNMDNLPVKLKNTSFAQDIKFNRKVNISSCEQGLLMLHIYIPGLMYVSCWKKKKPLMRLIEQGSKKVQKNMNMNNILNQLQELRMIIFQQKMKDVTNQWIYKHSPGHLIDCDSNEEDAKDNQGHHDLDSDDQEDQQFLEQAQQQMNREIKYKLEGLLSKKLQVGEIKGGLKKNFADLGQQSSENNPLERDVDTTKPSQNAGSKIRRQLTALRDAQMQKASVIEETSNNLNAPKNNQKNNSSALKNSNVQDEKTIELEFQNLEALQSDKEMKYHHKDQNEKNDKVDDNTSVVQSLVDIVNDQSHDELINQLKVFESQNNDLSMISSPVRNNQTHFFQSQLQQSLVDDQKDQSRLGLDLSILKEEKHQESVKKDLNFSRQ